MIQKSNTKDKGGQNRRKSIGEEGKGKAQTERKENPVGKRERREEGERK